MTSDIADRFASLLGAAASRLGDGEPGAAVRLAARFGIGGYVARHTAVADERARAARLLAGMVERNLLDAAQDISQELERKQIPHFFVKGIALAGRVYRLGDREMADIDMHVPRAAKPDALEALRRLGYAPIGDREQGAPDSMRSGVSLQRLGATDTQLHEAAVDLRWGIDPVDRLLPRPDKAVPNSVWRSLDESGPVPVPVDSHHIALMVHHLVHHDMFHVRGLLDIALSWQRLGPDAGAEIERVVVELQTVRALRIVAHVLSSHFGLDSRGVSPCPQDARARRLLTMLQPANWFVWAAEAPAREFVRASSRRVARRLLMVDNLSAVGPLLKDALVPPTEYVRWRWPRARSPATARLRHLLRVARKSLGGQ